MAHFDRALDWYVGIERLLVHSSMLVESLCCVLDKTLYLLLCPASTQGDPP